MRLFEKYSLDSTVNTLVKRSSAHRGLRLSLTTSSLIHNPDALVFYRVFESWYVFYRVFESWYVFY